MPERWAPEPPKRAIGKRGRAVLAWVLGFNLLMLMVAPIGGVSLIDTLAWLFGKAG